MRHPGRAPEIDLPAPGAGFADLGGVGGAGGPVGDEGYIWLEGGKVDAAAEIDEAEADAAPGGVGGGGGVGWEAVC